MKVDSLASGRKEERLDVRLRRDAKQLIARAAALTGQSLSDFVVSAVLERSRDVIERASSLELSEDEATRFLEALATPPAPNVKLREAAELYRKAVAKGLLQTA